MAEKQDQAGIRPAEQPGKSGAVQASPDERPVDVSAEVNLIWSIANMLRGPYREDKYKDVIIPMTIIRRLECALAPTKDAVREVFLQEPDTAPQVLCSVSGFPFYNTSEYTLARLADEHESLAANFEDYVDGFSGNVADILGSLGFKAQIGKMNESRRLFGVVRAFAALDLNPETVDCTKMGYVFEDLIRRFSENAEAGDHYTGRDVIRLMASILTAEGCDEVFDEGRIVKVLDQACGTGGMLFTAADMIHGYNPDIEIRLFGQEINPESYAICQAEALIRETCAEAGVAGTDEVHHQICLQNTLAKDCFEGLEMDFVIENPPFGTPWGGREAPEGSEEAVKAEAKRAGSRWPAGLPGAGDAQMLFLQSGAAKLSETGRMAIVLNGSPLFAGGPGSGESKIRRWLLENDWLEAIVALPTDLFYNTGIATYVWIVSKRKDERRRGKVQLINAAGFGTRLRKPLGSKRNEISPEDRLKITALYAAFEEGEFCRILRNEDFMYRVFTVMEPLRRNYMVSEERIRRMLEGGVLPDAEAEAADLDAREEMTAKDAKRLEKLKKDAALRAAVLERLRACASEKVWTKPEGFMAFLKERLAGAGANGKLLERIAAGLSERDGTAPVQKDAEGNVLYDAETKETERIPFLEDVDAYMAREVLPFMPEAAVQEKLTSETGAEIPFGRHFYRYEAPAPAEELQAEFLRLEAEVQAEIAELFGQGGAA